MSFIRIIISVLISAGLWILCGILIPAGRQGKYIILVCDEAAPDREIYGRLESRGITGVISESCQYVYLDCFDGIESIPLDEYNTRVLPFDPRNDGYAGKLRALFVRDGKRFIYIPRSGTLLNRIIQAMGDIPCTVESSGSGSGRLPALLAAALFCLAMGTFFLVRPLRRTLKPFAAYLVPCMPILAPFALGGAWGFTLAALLSGASVVIAGRLESARPRRRRLGLQWLLPAAFIVCYTLAACFSGLPLLVILLVTSVFCCIFILSFRHKTQTRFIRILPIRRTALNHRYFSPVAILKPRTADFSFAPAMIPFAAAAIVLSFTDVSPIQSLPADLAFLNSPETVTEADYYNHVYFQSTFSLRSLNDGAINQVSGMPAYELAPDGLPVQVPGSFTRTIDDAPPFRLAPLLRELNAAGSSDSSRSGNSGLQNGYAEQNPSLFHWLILIPWLFIIPAVVYWIRPGKHRKYTL